MLNNIEIKTIQLFFLDFCLDCYFDMAKKTTFVHNHLLT